MYTHSKQIITGGTPLETAKKALVLIHGRGASANSMMGLAAELQLADTAILAPQATNNSWYPYSFMAPGFENQPALNSALEVLDQVVADIQLAGIPKENIFFLGFSQGACLALEYTARNAARYGGIVAFTGGLIGERLVPEHYSGDFGHTPVLITTGDPDPHVPLRRVEDSVNQLKDLNADVTMKVYKGRGHTVQEVEIVLAKELVFQNN